jgi:tetratricopeptide (TPR) repeat protein
MRLAPRTRPVIFGLPLLICQLFVNLSAAQGWESARGVDGADSTPAAAGSLRFVTPVAASQTHQISDTQPHSQATKLRIIDPAVQPAGWNGERRIPRSIGPTHPAAAMIRDDQSPDDRPGANAGRSSFRLPSLFGRKGDPAAASGMRQLPPANQTRLNPANQASRQAMGAASGAGQRPNRTMGQSARPNGAQRRQLPATSELRITESDSPHAGKTPQTTQPIRRGSAQSPGTDVKSPSTRPSQPSVAKTAANTGQPSRAELLLSEAHELSRDAHSQQDYTRIIESCRRALASQPSAEIAGYANELAAWSLNRRGQLKADAVQVREAMLDFEDAIRADSNCWRAVHNRGVLRAQAGQFEKAFDDFNRTIQIKPDYAKAYANRGALFVVASDLNAALKDYGRAIELDADLAVAHRGRGRVCHLLGRLDEAIAHYDAAVQLAPDDSYALVSRADLLTDMGRYVDACAQYDRAIELDPQSVYAYSGSAWLLATCPDGTVRNPALAIERAKKSIQLSGKKDALNFDTLAAAQAAAGNFSAAVQTLRQAIELAEADERDVYQERLAMYQHAQPYRIAPMRPVAQASYEVKSHPEGTRRGAGSRE